MSTSAGGGSFHVHAERGCSTSQREGGFRRGAIGKTSSKVFAMHGWCQSSVRKSPCVTACDSPWASRTNDVVREQRQPMELRPTFVAMQSALQRMTMCRAETWQTKPTRPQRSQTVLIIVGLASGGRTWVVISLYAAPSEIEATGVPCTCPASVLPFLGRDVSRWKERNVSLPAYEKALPAAGRPHHLITRAVRDCASR